jgi:hypothetical protein
MYEAMAFIMLSIKVTAFCKARVLQLLPVPDWDAAVIVTAGGS